MAGGRTNGASLGVALCAALVGSAVIFGFGGSPFMGSKASPIPSGVYKYTTLTTVIAGKLENCPPQLFARQLGGAPNPEASLQRYLKRSGIAWHPNDWNGGIPLPAETGNPTHQWLFLSVKNIDVTVGQGPDGTWGVTQVQSCKS